MNIAPNNITSLLPNQVFVFGSNDQGVHGAGAARTARELFGARLGEHTGPTGRCYGIVTRWYDYTVRSKRFSENLKNVPVEDIKKSVDSFLYWAKTNTHLDFMVTKIGCGHAGHSEEEIAPLFSNAIRMRNVYLPESFIKIIENAKHK